jgi:hypothetical protein
VPATPVKAEVGLVGVVTVPPAPAMMVQVPVPTTGVFPAKVADVPQIVWSVPALETDGFPTNEISTASMEGPHGAFVIVHFNEYALPATPVNVEVGEVGVVIVPPTPVTILHIPVPTIGVFPAKVAEVPQIIWSGPALALVGLAVRLMTTSSIEAAQGAFAIVQRKV